MPIPLLQQLHKDTGLPMYQLEECWEKAKELATKKGRAGTETFWAYTMGIFQNLIGLSSTSASTSTTKWPDWWVEMSKKAREGYIKEHPESHFAKQKQWALRVPSKEEPKRVKPVVPAQKKNPELPKVSVPKYAEHSDFDPDKTDTFSDFGANSDVEDADTPPSKKNGESVSMRKAITNAYKGAKESITNTLDKHNKGLKSVSKFMTGGELSQAEVEHAKDFAKLAGTLLVGALVAATMVTPLAGLGPELGEYFLTMLTPESRSSSLSSATLISKTFMDKFHDWLITQDVSKLAATLTERKDARNLS
jgi:hypothetical protein